MRPVLLACAAVAILLAAALPVQAHHGSFVMDAMDYNGASHFSGPISMFYLAGGASEPDSSVPDLTGTPRPTPASPWMDLAATKATTWLFTAQNIAGPNENEIAPYDPRQPPSAKQSNLTNLNLRLSGFGSNYQVHVIALDQGAQMEAADGAGILETSELPQMGPGRWGTYEGNNGDVGEPLSENPTYFASVAPPGPLLIHSGKTEGFTTKITGHFALEFYWVTMTGTSTEGKMEFATGVFRDSHPGLPSETTPIVALQERRFARIYVEDGTLEVAAQGGIPKVHWAAPSVQSHHDGTLTLRGAVGQYTGTNNEINELRGGTHRLVGEYQFRLEPASGKLGATFKEEPSRTNFLALDMGANKPATLVGVGAMLALLAAVGVGLMRRKTSLSEVERALEGNKFRRAARLANRILRRAPRFEDAVLARGIALSKSGRHRRAVREIGAHLAGGQATDGALHYVMGLAHLEMGQQREGQAALAEAARLTPALSREIEGKIDPAPTPSKPRHIVLEGPGYA